MLRVHRPGRVQVAVRLLRRRDDHEDAVDIGLQLFVRIGLKHVGCAFDGLIDVGVVKGIALHLITEVHRRMHLLLRLYEVLVTAFAFALGEGQGNGDLAGGFQPLSPERIRGHLHAGERNRVDGITAGGGLRLQGCGNKNTGKEENRFVSHSA